MIPFDQIDQELGNLLQEFGPYSQTYRTEYPFWRLQNDDQIWELSNISNIQTSPKKDVSKRKLLHNQVAGGFPLEIYEYLILHPNEIVVLAYHILTAHFPDTVIEEIFQAVHLNQTEEVYDWVRRRRRNPKFRYAVLDAYNNCCALCGYDVKLGEKSIGLEAAHIKWDSHNGPNLVQNGLLLCAIHHKLFDRGAWTLSKDGLIDVSPHVKGTIGLQEWLLRFKDKPLFQPKSSIQEPDPIYGTWHRKEVFKKRERSEIL
ncbi:MAG: phosphorothioated DNA-binding restriction endonuclease [Bacteroidota bacterium]